MKAIHAMLVCLIVSAIFTHIAAATFEPLVQQEDKPELNDRTASCNVRKAPRKRLPGLTILGDPIEDPTPHNH